MLGSVIGAAVIGAAALDRTGRPGRKAGEALYWAGCEAARVCPAEDRLFKVVRFGVAHSRAPMYRMYTEEGLRGAAGEFARMKELSGGREVQGVG